VAGPRAEPVDAAEPFVGLRGYMRSVMRTGLRASRVPTRAPAAPVIGAAPKLEARALRA